MKSPRKMFRVVAAVGAFLVSMTPSFAQEVSELPTPVNSSSAQVRGDKRYGVGIEAGLIMGGLSGVGFEGFAQINRHLSIGGVFEAAGTSLNLEKPSVEVSVDINGYTGLAQARYFFGNSFYLKGALGYRQLLINLHGEAKSTSTSADMTIKANSVMSGVGIGNMWTFDNGFSIGGEWFGLYAPITGSYTSKTDVTELTSKEEAELNKLADTYGERFSVIPTSHVAVLTLGLML